MHSIITGMTGSGKTTLARIIALQADRKDIEVLIYDPYADRWPGIAYSKLEPFLNRVKSCNNRLVIVDEGGHTLDRHDKEHHWLATQSRHYGHSVIFIGQRYTQFAPIVRANCERAYFFRQPKSDLQIAAADYVQDSLDGYDLERLQFICVGCFEKIRKGRVDYKKERIIWE